MANTNIQKFADMLYDSAKTHIAISPLTQMDSSLTVDDAYAIQLSNVERLLKENQKISGKKIGLTSGGIQEQLGVNEPDYGHLFKSMDCSDGKILYKVFLQPKIEGEIAFVLKEDLTGGKITREDVIDATEYVAGAFEIVDSRIADWDIKIEDTISDNASSGCYVLGEIKKRLNEIHLPSLTMMLYKNGKLVQEGNGAAVLGDPCLSVVWLANRLLEYGVALKKGEIVLSGAFSAAPMVERGDIFEACFSELGIVRAEFI